MSFRLRLIGWIAAWVAASGLVTPTASAQGRVSLGTSYRGADASSTQFDPFVYVEMGLSGESDVASGGVRSQIPVFILDQVVGLFAGAGDGDFDPRFARALNRGTRDLFPAGLADAELRFAPMRRGGQALDFGLDARFRFWDGSIKALPEPDDRLGVLSFTPRITGGYVVKDDAFLFKSFVSTGPMLAEGAGFSPELGLGASMHLQVFGPIEWYLRTELSWIYFRFAKTEPGSGDIVVSFRESFLLSDVASGLALRF